MAELQINSMALCEKYLGLPTSVGQNKWGSFVSIKEGYEKEKLLSKVRKEILIRAVAQSILTYSMNCFLLSKS